MKITIEVPTAEEIRERRKIAGSRILTEVIKEVMDEVEEAADDGFTRIDHEVNTKRRNITDDFLERVCREFWKLGYGASSVFSRKAIKVWWDDTAEICAKTALDSSRGLI